jgi:hypothetical protein
MLCKSREPVIGSLYEQTDRERVFLSISRELINSFKSKPLTTSVSICQYCVPGTFNTAVDIKLRQWAEQQLPQKSVESGWEGLQTEFQRFMEHAKKRPDHDSIFDNLKTDVVDEAVRRHSWEDKVPVPVFIEFCECGHLEHP